MHVEKNQITMYLVLCQLDYTCIQSVVLIYN